MRIIVTVRAPDKHMEGTAYIAVNSEEWAILPHSELHWRLSAAAERAICRLVDERAGQGEEKDRGHFQ